MSRRCSAAMDFRPARILVLAIFGLLWTRTTFCEPRHSLHRLPSRASRSQARSSESSVGLSERVPATRSERGRLGASPEDKGFSELKKQLNVKAVGSGRGSFILEMGGVKILVNPNLEGSSVKPETVHEDFDYVFLTSEEPEFFHRETVNKMKLTKVKFVASAKAGQELTKMMVRNLAVLQNGPGGQCTLVEWENVMISLMTWHDMDCDVMYYSLWFVSFYLFILALSWFVIVDHRFIVECSWHTVARSFRKWHLEQQQVSHVIMSYTVNWHYPVLPELKFQHSHIEVTCRAKTSQEHLLASCLRPALVVCHGSDRQVAGSAHYETHQMTLFSMIWYNLI